MENYINHVLKTHHVKSTAMRQLILQYLVKSDIAVSLTDIENYFDRSERTTLFRTLKTFVSKEIVHKIDDGTGVTKYAMCEEGCHCMVEKDLHVHFHCNCCNETICLPNIKIPPVELPEGYTTDNVNLVMTGVCEKCKRISLNKS